MGKQRYDDNELRAKKLVEKYQFHFIEDYRVEIIQLLEQELANYHEGSSEYLRFLCGFLFCIGNNEDIDLLNKIKWGINMDVGTMIDSEWIENLENNRIESKEIRNREEIIAEFIDYYTQYFQYE